MSDLKNVLLLAEAALDCDDERLVCGDAPPSGRCNECYGCLTYAAREAVREVLTSEYGVSYPPATPQPQGANE